MPSIPQCGVYRITCLPTGQVYIGSSVNIHARWRHHRRCLITNTHQNRALQSAWDTYGIAAFHFEIIEQTTADDRNSREQFWIRTYQATDPVRGFNIRLRGNSHPIDEVTKKKLSDANRGKKLTPEHRKKIAVSSVKRGISAETRAKMVESRKRNGPYIAVEVQARSAQKRAKTYICTAPNGQQQIVINLTAFCHQHGLHYHSMLRVIRGERTHHHGWSCRALREGE